MATNREKEVKVAITARSKDEGEMLHHVIRSCGFDHIQIFSSPRVTLEVAKRSQFQLFVTNNDFPDMTGLTMLQTLRSNGNYGVEPHLFMIDHLNSEIMLVLVENNIQHVLTKPYSADRINQKLMHLWKEETHMSPAEQQFREAHAAMNAGLKDMAQELGLLNLKNHGPSEKLLLMLGDIEARQGHAPEARQYYDAAQKYNPKSSAAAHKLAQTYMLEKNFAKAAELMNELTKLNPLNLELLANAGLSNFEIGNIEEAKAAMGQLQSLDAERKDASEILARVALQQGDYAAALEQLKGTHDQKELIQVLNNAGIKLSHEDDPKGAIDMYTKTLALLGNNPYTYAIYYNLGLAYLKLHDNDNAKTWLKKALDAKPDFEKAANALHRIEPKSA